MSDEDLTPRSLASTRAGTHVDFVQLQVTQKVVTEGTWSYDDAFVDRPASEALVNAAIETLEAAGRTIVSVEPVTSGLGRYYATPPRSTSSLGVTKSEEFGYGYSFTQAVMIVSRS